MATRQDIELRRRVQAELDWEPDLRDQEIALAVTDGVVTLWGQVVDAEQKRVAMAAVRRVLGVEVVADELRVRSDGDLVGCDVEIAHAVHHHLKLHVKAQPNCVTATVVRGWVTLEGMVESLQQRVDAERSVRGICGVRGVTNRLQVV